MSKKLLKQNQQLEIVRYFTARVRNNPGKVRRQNTYLDALATLPDVRIHEGYFLGKNQKCANCGATYLSYEEKTTDVNIAVELLCDAQDDIFDTAIIVSADGDLVGPVEAVLKRYSDKKIIVTFPPDRHSANLEAVASDHRKIEEREVSGSQFPNRVRSNAGYRLRKPPEWK